MRDLTKLCADEFALHVNELFQKIRIETYSRGAEWVEAPIVGLFHPIWDEAASAALKELSRRALAWRERFAVEGPPWAQPLPTIWNDCCRLAHQRDDGQMHLLGQFASSLLGDKWDPAHPSFDRFCRGLMATPGFHLRNDPELQRLYPPKRLPGLMSSEMAGVLDHVEMRLAAKAAKRQTAITSARIIRFGQDVLANPRELNSDERPGRRWCDDRGSISNVMPDVT